jgi:hypothetical protein
MTKWEYGVAMFQLEALDEAFEADRLKLEEALNRWGSLGSELVSFVSYSPRVYLAIFKSPKDRQQ